MKKLVLLGALALAPILAQAQYSNYPAVIPFPGAPSGSCAAAQLAVNMATGALSSCLNSSWTAVASNPFSSGGTTINVLTKSDGASKLADSSITDAGTTVNFTEPLVLPDTAGSGVPSVKGATAATGLYLNGVIAGLVSTTNGWIQVSSTAATALQLPVTGILGWSSSGTIGGAGNDTFFGRDSARVLRIGTAALAAPQANTLQIGESSRAATDTDTAGSSGTIRPGDGTGTGAATKLCLQRNLMRATSSTAQSQIDGYCVGPSKTLSNTSATAQSLVNISVPSNSAGGVEGTITLTCTDGTNFDSETQSFNTSFVNKAGALTVTAPVITATTAANNSGSCTAGITAVAGTNSVDIKVTPVFGTIVPTVVTSYITLRNNGTGNATFN